MKEIKITTVSNTLDNSTVKIKMNGSSELSLEAGESVNQYTNLTIPILDSLDQINSENICQFEIAALGKTFYFAAIEGTGLVSALGPNMEDFNPEDPTRREVSHPGIEDGNEISLHFHFIDLSPGERATWVLGELDDNG